MTIAPGVSAAGGILLGLCIVAALVLMLIGALRVVRLARPLKRRLDDYNDLPVLRVLAATQARLNETSARLSELSVLLVRAQVALATIRVGFDSLRASVLYLGAVFANAREIATRLLRLVGLVPRASRSPGS